MVWEQHGDELKWLKRRVKEGDRTSLMYQFVANAWHSPFFALCLLSFYSPCLIQLTLVAKKNKYLQIICIMIKKGDELNLKMNSKEPVVAY